MRQSHATGHRSPLGQWFTEILQKRHRSIAEVVQIHCRSITHVLLEPVLLSVPMVFLNAGTSSFGTEFWVSRRSPQILEFVLLSEQMLGLDPGTVSVM